ncbi:hypothetical protein LWI29_005166 [Acer saccharum]|uniref:RNase H type-1 domain-containing protein n=1 Tax=Acer saccharum TaxID=4024 RepID=A0AA39W0V3_ACESA|nr:hypothetical protein LWI29_005166 [Acer saccharum]
MKTDKIEAFNVRKCPDIDGQSDGHTLEAGRLQDIKLGQVGSSGLAYVDQVGCSGLVQLGHVDQSPSLQNKGKGLCRQFVVQKDKSFGPGRDKYGVWNTKKCGVWSGQVVKKQKKWIRKIRSQEIGGNGGSSTIEIGEKRGIVAIGGDEVSRRAVKLGRWMAMEDNGQSIVQQPSDGAKVYEVELFCIIVWRIWSFRNSYTHRSILGKLSEVFDWCEQFLKDFQDAKREDRTKQMPKDNMVICWLPPEVGVYKANCDVKMDKLGGCTGIGVVVRDHRGEVFASCSQTLEANLTIKAAKLTAFLKNIQFVIDCGLEPCVFEGDDATVVKWTKEDSHYSSDNGFLLNDISSLCKQFSFVKFGHCPKRANLVASALACHALKISNDGFWMEECPGSISEIVEVDKPR